MALPNYVEEPVELRCEGGAMHGILKDGLVEIKCHHIRCTKGKAAVFHYFDPMTGDLVNTVSYKDPTPRMKGHRK